MRNPALADMAAQKASFLYRLLDRKYWVDELYFKIFADGSRGLGKGLWKGGDVTVIDGVIINGSARLVNWVAGVVRHVQTGMLYHYAFAMIIGLLLLLLVFVN
jgi:NADH-quinone oxidoreductase subunit L